MKTGAAILFCLGCLGLAAGMAFGPTSENGALMGIGIVAAMMVVAFIAIKRGEGF